MFDFEVPRSQRQAIIAWLRSAQPARIVVNARQQRANQALRRIVDRSRKNRACVR